MMRWGVGLALAFAVCGSACAQEKADSLEKNEMLSEETYYKRAAKQLLDRERLPPKPCDDECSAEETKRTLEEYRAVLSQKKGITSNWPNVHSLSLIHI